MRMGVSIGQGFAHFYVKLLAGRRLIQNAFQYIHCGMFHDAYFLQHFFQALFNIKGVPLSASGEAATFLR